MALSQGDVDEAVLFAKVTENIQQLRDTSMCLLTASVMSLIDPTL